MWSLHRSRYRCCPRSSCTRCSTYSTACLTMRCSPSRPGNCTWLCVVTLECGYHLYSCIYIRPSPPSSLVQVQQGLAVQPPNQAVVLARNGCDIKGARSAGRVTAVVRLRDVDGEAVDTSSESTAVYDDGGYRSSCKHGPPVIIGKPQKHKNLFVEFVYSSDAVLVLQTHRCQHSAGTPSYLMLNPNT